MTDLGYMRRALFHAARAEGATTPNPMVGVVIVSAGGVVVGQGRHMRAGDPHAEVHALDEAGAAARGGTLYATLEPCCHTGRTGPCTARILDAGVRRVVVAMQDPNPLVNGRGLAMLRQGGVTVEVGLLEAHARRLNAPFISVHTRGRPLVAVKAALSLDGRIAAAAGQRTAISSPAANRDAQRLRAAVDAIGVGSETVLVDDPLLTVRELVRFQPLIRVVFDRRLRTPPSARLFSTLSQGPVIILTTSRALADAPARAEALEAAGATLVAAPPDLPGALMELARRDVSVLLLEGGAHLHAAAWKADLVDRVYFIVAPFTLGDTGVRLFGGSTIERARIAPVVIEPRGSDVWMEADVHRDR